MLDYQWPGNIRQLESVVERAYIMSDEDVIREEHIPEEIKQGKDEPSRDKLRLIADYLIDAKLTAAEYRLYLYLTKLDAEKGPNADPPEPKAVMEQLGINRDTFFVGVAKLKELGLYNFSARRAQAKRAGVLRHGRDDAEKAPGDRSNL
jgi:DNA-binding NtrC family response regulator